MKYFKKLLLPVSVLLSVSILSSCGGKSEGITLTVWEDESNIETLKTLADEFVRTYKTNYPLAETVTIKFVAQSEKSAIEKLITVGPTGNGPDVLAITHDTIASGVKSGVIAEASYYSELQNRMSDGAMNAVTYNNKVYGYPITAESMTLMYDNTQLSTTDVVSFESLLASGKKIALDMQVDGAYYCWGLCTDSVLFGENGKDSKTVDISTTKTLNNWVSFLNDYSGCVSSMIPESSLSLLSSKQIAGVITSPFMYSSIVDALGNGNVGLAALPTINGENERPFSGYKAYAVNKYTKNPTLAQEFANFMVSDDAQTWRLSKKSYLPTVKTYTTDMEEILENSENKAHLNAFRTSLSQSITMPNIEQMSNFWKPMNNAVNTLWSNKTTKTDTATVKGLFDQVTNVL